MNKLWRIPQAICALLVLNLAAVALFGIGSIAKDIYYGFWSGIPMGAVTLAIVCCLIFGSIKGFGYCGKKASV